MLLPHATHEIYIVERVYKAGHLWLIQKNERIF